MFIKGAVKIEYVESQTQDINTVVHAVWFNQLHKCRGKHVNKGRLKFFHNIMLWDNALVHCKD